MSGWSFVRRLKKEVLFISRAPLLACLLPTVDELLLEGSHFQLARAFACLLPTVDELLLEGSHFQLARAFACLLACLLPTVDELLLEGSHFQLARPFLPIRKERTIATRIPVVPVFVSN